MQWRIVFAVCVAGCTAWGSCARAGENWPAWRGPAANGTSDSQNLPTTWGPDQHVVWRADLPSWSGGSPVIWGDRVFVTSPAAPPKDEKSKDEAKAASADPPVADAGAGPPPEGGPGGDGGGRRRRGRGGPGGGMGGMFGPKREPGGQSLLLMCLSKRDGSVLWEKEFDHGNETKMKQNSSSPSPVTDGRNVWAVTGNGEVAAFDVDGKELWKKNLQETYGRFGLNWGYASSPLLYDGKLIIEVLHGSHTHDPSYVIAFDGETGEVLWRVERQTDATQEAPDAYTTPALFTSASGPQIVVSGADYVTAHDPATGKEVWRAGGLNPSKERDYRIVGSPFVVGGTIFAPTRKTPILALRGGGTGDVTESGLIWKFEGKGAPDVPTPVSDGTYFYMVDDRGLATCLDAKTGQVEWGPERTALGSVSASPVLADGKLYITNESGVTTVLAAGPEFKVLATNELDNGYTLSSLAVSGSQLFLRTAEHLYCIGQ
ncbi:MAG TPA: PQQ-binding-like beta-propeller repeat protein [Pirellulales bacterium]